MSKKLQKYKEQTAELTPSSNILLENPINNTLSSSRNTPPLWNPKI
jgi:hypothetical protein